MRFLSLLSLLGAWMTMASWCSAQTSTNPYFELIHFQGVDVERMPVLDQYFEKALLPALNKQGIRNVGVFREEAETEGKTSMYLLLTLDRLQTLSDMMAAYSKDPEFQKAAADYFQTDPKKPLYSRARSELMVAFDCMPHLQVPKQKGENKNRYFELRTYESPNELTGMTKVEMFNSGEVPIFLACGIQPVFFGQAIIGDRMPNLTYMTVYDNAEQMAESWKKFREHPDWKKLSSLPKYKDIVSKIYKTPLLPRPYSQL